MVLGEYGGSNVALVLGLTSRSGQGLREGGDRFRSGLSLGGTIGSEGTLFFDGA